MGLGEEEGEGGGAVVDLVGLGHVQDFGDGFGVNLDDFLNIENSTLIRGPGR